MADSQTTDSGPSIQLHIIIAILLPMMIGFGFGLYIGKQEVYKEAEEAGVGYYKSGLDIPMGEWRMVWKGKNIEYQPEK